MEKPLSRTVSVESTRSWQQLTTASGSSAAGRKAKSSEPETGGSSVNGVFMPPSVPSRRPSHASHNSFLELLVHAKSNNDSAIEDTETTPTLEGVRSSFAPVNALLLPEAFRPPRSDVDAESKRLSFSSLYSLGSAIYANTRGHSWSGRSSLAGSEAEGMSGLHLLPQLLD
jgi:inositol hexakisphosphate/diphosphoinositol-pentakisphosphate kinase